MNSNQRLINFYKRQFELDDIDYKDINLLSKREFFQKYPKITLKQKTIKIVIHYYKEHYNLLE